MYPKTTPDNGHTPVQAPTANDRVTHAHNDIARGARQAIEDLLKGLTQGNAARTLYQIEQVAANAHATLGMLRPGPLARKRRRRDPEGLFVGPPDYVDDGVEGPTLAGMPGPLNSAGPETSGNQLIQEVLKMAQDRRRGPSDESKIVSLTAALRDAKELDDASLVATLRARLNAVLGPVTDETDDDIVRTTEVPDAPPRLPTPIP